MCNSQPRAPDPYATAQAQGQANVDAAVATAGLNRPNQITPWGDQTWEKNPNDPTQWTSTVTLSENQQQLNDTQDQIAIGLGDTQNAALGRVQDTLGQGVNTGDLPARMSVAEAMDASGNSVTNRNNLYDAASTYMDQSLLPRNLATKNYNRTLNSDMPQGGRTQLPDQFSTPDGQAPNFNGVEGQSPSYSSMQTPVEGFNGIEGQASYNAMGGEVSAYSGPTAPNPNITSYKNAPDYQRVGGNVPTSDQGYRAQIQDALYNQQKSRLDPRFNQQRGDLESRLATQGITQGSEAYEREVANLGRTENDAYSQAAQLAISGGEQAVAGQFGRDMGSRQQRVGESDLDYRNRMATHQQNTNQVTQQFQNEMGLRQQSTAEAAQAFNSNLAARQQAFEESNQAFENELAARQQNFGEADQGFTNNMAARQQQVGENLQDFNAQLASRQQRVGESDLDFQNQMASRQQQVGESDLQYQNRMAEAGMDLAANAQYFNQGMAGRQQAGNEFLGASGVVDAATGRLLQNADGRDRAEATRPGLAGQYMGLSDNARNNMLSEELALRNLPLNELNALRTGAQVTTPQFTSGQSGANVDAAPVADSIWNSYNGQVANNSSMMGGLSQLGGSFLTAAGAAGGVAPLMAGL